MRILGREPALWLTLIQTVLALAVGIGLPVSGEQVGLINGAAAAVLALVAAFAVQPFPVPLLMGAIQALIALAVGFGLGLGAEQVSLLNAAAAALVGFIMRMHVSPSVTPNGHPGVHSDKNVTSM
ncbi:hypothetical protein [Nonomuraea sp. NPDC049480]|uniref:hypothetical protein n=1 Tax=Nonomuraea sp. NPDC049480 TaxID=3364353 RepID=UPI0037A316BE